MFNILAITPLSELWFANIFFHLVGCFSTRLITFFAVPKFLCSPICLFFCRGCPYQFTFKTNLPDPQRVKATLRKCIIHCLGKKLLLVLHQIRNVSFGIQKMMAVSSLWNTLVLLWCFLIIIAFKSILGVLYKKDSLCPGGWN